MLILEPGTCMKHVVRGNICSVDGFFAFRRDSDLRCPASSCPPNNPSQGGRPNIQPALCPLSRGFRSVKYQKLQVLLNIWLMQCPRKRHLVLSQAIEHFEIQADIFVLKLSSLSPWS